MVPHLQIPFGKLTQCVWNPGLTSQTLFDIVQKCNESYYAFGQEYLAPADGTVIRVENDIEDNEPGGVMNEAEPFGNYVVLNHGKEEYSYLAHFNHQSIEMEEGDEVKQGDVLGLVGNSGNSSEPHIHFHAADGPDPAASKSIRINFGQDDFTQGDFVKRAYTRVSCEC